MPTAARRACRPRAAGGIKHEGSRGSVRIAVAVCLVLLGFFGASLVMRLVGRRMASSSFSDRLPIVLVLVGLAVAVFAVARLRRKKSRDPNTDAV